jgi:hypothetical protein
MSNRYCLDTSVFINSWNQHYRIDVFPAVWTALDGMIREGRVISCAEVYAELEKQRDELLAWVKPRKHVFHSPTNETTDQMKELMGRYPNFAAAGGSANAADPWLIAHARVTDTVIVTFEQFQERSKATKPPKIPNVCHDLGIRCLKPIDFLAENGISFF